MIDCDYSRDATSAERRFQLALVVRTLKAHKPNISFEELLEVRNTGKINKYRFAAMCRHVMNNPWPYQLGYMR